MSRDKALTWEREGNILNICLNRPEALNAISARMLDSMEEALALAESDALIRAVTITGNGRAFCVGADLTELNDVFTEDPGSFLSVDGFATRLSAVLTRIDELPKPVVGGLNGLTIGGGLELALVCDLLIATPVTMIGDGHVNFGLLPSGGASGRLPARLGTSWARRLALTGELVNAQELVSCGFVTRVVEPSDLHTTVSTTAAQLAGKDPTALGRLKELSRLHLQHPHDEVLVREHGAMDRHVVDGSMLNGISRFLGRSKGPTT